jgi:hypothetical protein
VDGIERDREQDEIAPEPGLEALLEDAKLLAMRRTEIRQRTTRVDEVDGDDLSPQV